MLLLRASMSIWCPVKGDAMAQNGGLKPSPYSVFLHESCRYPELVDALHDALDVASPARGLQH